jgi:hypothetical protein
MVKIELDIDFDEDGLRDALAEKYAAQLEQSNNECPNEDCNGESFDAEMWINQSGHFEGAAVCRTCNNRFDLNIDDSQVQKEIQQLENQIEDMF